MIFCYQDVDANLLIEISEDNIIIGADCGGGTASVVSPNYQLLQAANYNKDSNYYAFLSSYLSQTDVHFFIS